MIQKEVQVINKLGLHVRPATQLVKLASEFEVEITLHCNGQDADAKSVMDVLMLAATINSMVKVTAVGGSPEDEEEAVDKIIELVNNRFNDKE